MALQFFSARGAVAALRFFAFAFLAVMALVLVVAFLAGPVQDGVPRLFDFHTFWVAGRAYAHGVDPYPVRIEGSVSRADWFVYPAPIAALFAPLGLLPYAVAWLLFAVVLVSATGAALWLVDVRDWRCYAIAFCCLPVLKAINLGTATPLLMLGVAVAWRFRDRLWVVAATTALTFLMKLFLWPLMAWLWWTGRRRAALIAAALAGAATIVGWLPLGLDSVRHYPTLMHQLSLAEARDGYGISGFASALHASPSLAALLPLLCAPIVFFGLRPVVRRVGERRALAVTVAAAVFISPIVWQHYFALAILAVALVSSELTPAWLLPLGYWALPEQQAWSSLWRCAIALILIAACLKGPGSSGVRPLRARWRGRVSYSAP